MATVKFVLSALYGEDFFKGDSSQNDGTGVEGVPYKRAGNDTGVIQIELIYSVGNETAKIIVPLITILPIPFIEINNLDIDFTANIKSFETQESKKDSSTKWNGKASANTWWGKYSFDTGIRTSSSVSSKSASGLTTEYNMNVSVNASNNSMPKGMSRVMDMLYEGIQSQNLTARTLMQWMPKARVKPTVNLPGIPWQELPGFMKELQLLDWPSARLLEFIILTASRSGEARGALWDEIDYDNEVWRIPALRMKMKRPHLVPLAGRTLSLVKQASNSRIGPLVFPNPKSNREFSYNAPRVTLRKLNQYNVTTHGFRSTFKTWALEKTNFPTQSIEFALAHETKNAVEGAYIRGDRMLEKRRIVMKSWEEYCFSH